MIRVGDDGVNVDKDDDTVQSNIDKNKSTGNM